VGLWRFALMLKDDMSASAGTGYDREAVGIWKERNAIPFDVVNSYELDDQRQNHSVQPQFEPAFKTKRFARQRDQVCSQLSQ
jgi:hypothetical protein